MQHFVILFVIITLFSVKTYSQEHSNENLIELINTELNINNSGRNNERSYDVELTSNGYFYCNSYYKGQKIGQYRIHIEDISVIENENLLGELHLKLKCKNSNDCSLWNNYGDDTVFNYMYIPIIDSRSGEYIESLIKKIVFNVTGENINEPNLINNKMDTSRSVYYCDSEYAYAYHSNQNCDGLSNCEHDIYKISERKVRNMGFRYCELCWE